MVNRLVRKVGIPALAYAANDVSGPRRYSLKILHSNAQFVVSLESPIVNQESEHLFTLRYEGNNLIPRKTLLRDVGISLSCDSLDFLARQGKPQLRTLSLMLKAPCSVWYPTSLHNKVSSLTGAYELLTLARSTEVLIIFDSNWLGKNIDKLRSVVERSGQLVGIPVLPQFARLYQQADWSILNSAQGAKSATCLLVGDLTSEVVPSIEDAIAGTPSLEDEEDDAPPSYASVPSKRQRDTRTSLTPDTPLPKRLLQERATSALSASATSTPSSTATVPVDIFQEAITSAVERLLPGILRKELGDLLPTVLSEMFTGSSPSPSLSPTPLRTPSHKTTPEALIRAAVSTAIKAHLERFLTTTLDEASEQVSELHKLAEVEFEDIRDGNRYELDALKEDHIAAFDDNCNAKSEEKLEEFKESLEEAREGAKAYADEVVLKTYNRLDMVFKMSGGHRCLDGAKDQQSMSRQGRRTMSLPL